MINGFVQTSPEIQALITFAVTALVSFIVLKLVDFPALKWLGEYLGQNKAAIVTWAVGLIVSFIDAQLLNVPLAWEPVAVLIGQLIVAVAAVFGVFGFLSNRGVRGLK